MGAFRSLRQHPVTPAVSGLTSLVFIGASGFSGFSPQDLYLTLPCLLVGVLGAGVSAFAVVTQRAEEVALLGPLPKSMGGP